MRSKCKKAWLTSVISPCRLGRAAPGGQKVVETKAKVFISHAQAAPSRRLCSPKDATMPRPSHRVPGGRLNIGSRAPREGGPGGGASHGTGAGVTEPARGYCSHTASGNRQRGQGGT